MIIIIVLLTLISLWFFSSLTAFFICRKHVKDEWNECENYKEKLTTFVYIVLLFFMGTVFLYRTIIDMNK